jgi:hypothetical protein
MSFPMPNGNPCECECECEWLSPLAIALASHQPMIPIITSEGKREAFFVRV